MSENKTPAPPEAPTEPPLDGTVKDKPEGVLGPLSIADLESDPDIKFHLNPNPSDPKDRFAIWSIQVMNQFESKVWKVLGGKKNPWLFVPQVEICGYVVDFYSPVHKVVLEADGPDHDRSVLKDQERDIALLKKKSIKTLRLFPVDLSTNTPQSLFKVIEHFIKPETVVTEAMIRGEEGGNL